MQSEKRKLSQRAMLTREFIFFTQHLGRVRLNKIQRAQRIQSKKGIRRRLQKILGEFIFLTQSVARVQFV